MRKGLTHIIALAALFVAAGASAQPIVTGFVEANQVVRVQENDALGDGAIGDRTYPRSELRAQMKLQEYSDRGQLFIRADFVSDAVASDRSHVDLREAYVKTTLFDWLDVKIGRQVATWGTGDLIFANDLFAKDWRAFFSGLDDTYLKPPQDLLRLTAYVNGLTLEVALSPYFTPDNLPDGTRLSVFNPFMNATVGAQQAPPIFRPVKTLRNGEGFGRVSGYSGSYEWALYGYKGFWPTPQAFTPDGVLYYPRLWSAGGSLRGPIGSYLLHAEAAAYISQDDTDGDNPFIANSQIRGFIGLDRSLANEWTVGVQYYGEYMLDHDLYLMGIPPGGPTFDELRSTVTARIHKFMRNQTVEMQLFGYWGLSDEDWHVRPEASYKVTQAIKWTVGASLIDGEDNHTMFGQFRDNSNVFTRVRYSF
ncbi:MAG: hypothetical protein GF341_01570 [candidate division Zixibacteria bacterium]|nr:hypothetical protein [candidate division Zixibacteria bacterium]